jgi:hypothetical protein
MTTLYQDHGVAAPIIFSTPMQLELQPIYGSIPAINRQRSTSDIRCGSIMLEKLRRREEITPDDFFNSLPKPHAGEHVVDAVVDKLIDVL